MKKIYKKLIVAAASLMSITSIAQVTAYSFTQTSSTYNAITGGTVYGSTASDDERYVDGSVPAGGTVLTGVGIPIGFNFVYNGVSFDRFAINNNGWITLGQSTLTPNPVNMNSSSYYNALSATSTAPALLSNRICGLANDMAGQTGSELRAQTIGVSPNQTLVVQWTNFTQYAVTGQSFNFQIRLSQTSNIVNIIYGTFTTTSSGSAQVGLRGNANTDFNNRNITSPTPWSSSIAGTANNAVANFNSTLTPVSGQNYQWTPPPVCAGAPASNSVVGTNSAVCSGGSSNLSLATTYTVGGIAYQWFSAPALSGPYTAISNATLTTYAATAQTVTTFYQAVITCTSGPASTTATPFQLTVNPLPTIVVSPTSTSICVPGSPSVALTASGGTSYTWSPSATLSNSVGTSVNALPFTTTVYNVTGSNSFGCTSTATTTINVSDKPTVLSLSATPSVICSGASSTLQASAALTSSYAITSIPYAAVTVPTTAVTLCNNGVATVTLTSGSLDDGGWANLNIPFNFNFFGSAYNSFAVSTNGFIFLGSGVPNTFTGYGNTLPYTFSARPSIGANYSDLDFDGTSSGSTIQYFTTGTTPNQKLVVNWTGQFYNNTGTVTTQAIIYETSNVIEVHTFTSTGTNASVEGIQNAAGTTAFVVTGRNAVAYTVATPDAYRWTPAGGTVTYSWSPSTFLSSTSTATTVANTATASTIYSVTLSGSNGCASTVSVGLTVNTTSISVNSGAVCSGNSFTITPTGASTYTFSSGPVVTPTSTSNYSVVGTGTNGCVSSTQVSTVTVNANPTITVASGTVCAGTAFTLNPSGASTYSYSSGPVVSPTTTSNYTVTGTNTASCVSAPVVATVAVNALPTVSLSTANNTLCTTSTGGTTVTLNGSPAGGTYTGTNVSGNVFTPSAIAGTFTPSYAVTNSVTGCSNTASITIVVSVCTGLDATTSSLAGLLVYPNPNTGIFTVELNNGSVKNIQVTDLTGRVVLSSTSSNDKVDFNISTLANGVYYVKIQSNNSVEVLKIVKQ